MTDRSSEELERAEIEKRRAFLKNCAMYAAAMPPAITLLLSAQNAFAQNDPSVCSNVICVNPGEPDACEICPPTDPLTSDPEQTEETK